MSGQWSGKPWNSMDVIRLAITNPKLECVQIFEEIKPGNHASLGYISVGSNSGTFTITGTDGFSGSGFVIHPGGYVIANHHVIAGVGHQVLLHGPKISNQPRLAVEARKVSGSTSICKVPQSAIVSICQAPQVCFAIGGFRRTFGFCITCLFTDS